jgi:hypothetical protein
MFAKILRDRPRQRQQLRDLRQRERFRLPAFQDGRCDFRRKKSQPKCLTDLGWSPFASASYSMDPYVPSCRIQPWARTMDWIKLSLCTLSDPSFSFHHGCSVPCLDRPSDFDFLGRATMAR